LRRAGHGTVGRGSSREKNIVGKKIESGGENGTRVGKNRNVADVKWEAVQIDSTLEKEESAEERGKRPDLDGNLLNAKGVPKTRMLEGGQKKVKRKGWGV